MLTSLSGEHQLNFFTILYIYLFFDIIDPTKLSKCFRQDLWLTHFAWISCTSVQLHQSSLVHIHCRTLCHDHHGHNGHHVQVRDKHPKWGTNIQCVRGQTKCDRQTDTTASMLLYIWDTCPRNYIPLKISWSFPK